MVPMVDTPRDADCHSDYVSHWFGFPISYHGFCHTDYVSHWVILGLGFLFFPIITSF